MPEVTFYFDLGSPYAYLTAERLLAGALPEPVAWQPISLGALFKGNGRSSWALRGPQPRAAGIAEIERRAGELGLPALRWPDPWPGNYLTAMRAATFAHGTALGRAFTIQAFRDAFQRGVDLSVAANVLDAAQRAGLDREAVDAATQDPQVKQALRAATDAAHARGVIGVPTVAIDGKPFWGDDRLAAAVAHISSATAGP
jgi:2-hydroxychromene-2-carboxylate isomerase